MRSHAAALLLVAMTVAACGQAKGGAERLAATSEDATTEGTAPVAPGTPDTTTTTGPAQGEVSDGDTSGPPWAWHRARVVGDRTIEVSTFGCGQPRGAKAALYEQQVVVTTYWQEPDRSGGAAPSCPPADGTFRLELPAPVAGRPVIDGAVSATPQRAVPWAKARTVFTDKLVRLQVTDPACRHLSGIHFVEDPTAVTISVTASATSSDTPDPTCASDPYESDFDLYAPLAGRHFVDGHCAYDPTGPGCPPPAGASRPSVVAGRPPGAEQPASPTAPCPDHLTEPLIEANRSCVPEAPAGNGSGPDGTCTGTETAAPCGAGVEAGRYYPYTLPLRCDGLAVFDGRRWYSMLPPPTEGGTMHVWMRLDPSGFVGFVSPGGAVGFNPDQGQTPPPCRGR